jgi:FkbM family methyltransferase
MPTNLATRQTIVHPVNVPKGPYALARVWKPWFVWRPRQALRRLVRGVRPLPPGVQPLEVAWGGTILADPSRHVGWSLATTGVHDLAVSEALVRLVTPGDTVIDAGANIGYMTVLAAALAGSAGRVYAFEPHPTLFQTLSRNVERRRRPGSASDVRLYDAALGASVGRARLVVPDGFESNDGLASVRRDAGDVAGAIDVAMTTIDDAVGPTSVGVLKLDVEGYELEVLDGAASALRRRAIRHIVFEDHGGPDSAVVRRLESHGYRVYAIGWSVAGLRIEDVRNGRLTREYEAPSYVATQSPAEAEQRCAPRGWRVLCRL